MILKILYCIKFPIGIETLYSLKTLIISNLPPILYYQYETVHRIKYYTRSNVTLRDDILKISIRAYTLTTHSI